MTGALRRGPATRTGPPSLIPLHTTTRCPSWRPSSFSSTSQRHHGLPTLRFLTFSVHRCQQSGQNLTYPGASLRSLDWGRSTASFVADEEGGGRDACQRSCVERLGCAHPNHPPPLYETGILHGGLNHRSPPLLAVHRGGRHHFSSTSQRHYRSPTPRFLTFSVHRCQQSGRLFIYFGASLRSLDWGRSTASLVADERGRGPLRSTPGRGESSATEQSKSGVADVVACGAGNGASVVSCGFKFLVSFA